MRIRHNLDRLPEFITFEPVIDEEYPVEDWYKFEDAEIGAWVDDTDLVIGTVCRQSRQDNMRAVNNPKSSGFLDRLLSLTEIIATVHGLERIVVDNIVNAFLPDALERRGFRTIRHRYLDGDYRIICIKSV